MKTLVMILLVIVVFLGCAVLGFQVAKDIYDPHPVIQTPDPGFDVHINQYNLVLVRVDQINHPQSRLISIWYISLYFLENEPTKLTVAPIYPGKSTTKQDRLEQAFGFTVDGELSPAFWKALRAYDLPWKRYIILDNEGANQFLQWLVGPGDFMKALEAAESSPENRAVMVAQTCQSIAEASEKELNSFNWSEIMSVHFQSDLQFDSVLYYWDRLMDTGPALCEIIPAP